MADAAKPKLVYFDIQGRAQAIRYLLTDCGVDFEDVRITQEEWGAAKAAGTYTAVGGSLPSYIEPNGEKKNQAVAILHHLAKKHGKTCATGEEAYEMHWLYETRKDLEDKDTFSAIFTEGADAAIIDKFIANVKLLMDKCDERWADGRERVAGGPNATAGDYTLLAGYTSIVTNANLRNPRISQECSAYAETKQNYMRVVNKIKADCQATVDAIPAGWV